MKDKNIEMFGRLRRATPDEANYQERVFHFRGKTSPGAQEKVFLLHVAGSTDQRDVDPLVLENLIDASPEGFVRGRLTLYAPRFKSGEFAFFPTEEDSAALGVRVDDVWSLRPRIRPPIARRRSLPFQSSGIDLD